MKQKTYIIIATFLSLGFLFTQCDAPVTSLSEEEFKDPSVEYRAMALYTWMNGYIDTTKLVYELEQMKEKGMRGPIIWDMGALADPAKMIPEGPAFLGDESLAYIDLALKTAERVGIDLGMAASSSWNAGGAWVDSSDASMQLLSTSHVVEGPASKKLKIEIPETRRGRVKTYSIISTIAIPWAGEGMVNCQSEEAVVLDDKRVDEKYIEWDVPEGKWEVFTYFMCNTGQNLVVPSPNSVGLVIDHLSERATKNHWDSVLSKLATISTPERHLKFLELDSYEVWTMKDWTPVFIREFKERYGYDPLPYMPLLLGYENEDMQLADRFRSDYSILVSDLMIENHFKQTMDIAEENGMELFSEAGHGGSPRVDPLKALGYSHIPMGEFWNRKRFWVTREAASAAHIYGRKLVAAESLTGWNHWQHGPADYKQLVDVAFCAGLNQIVFHTFAHNPEIAGKPGFGYHAGEHLNVNMTWWDEAKPFMDYLGRCSYMLRQGNFVADACLYYGDQAPNLVPPDRIDPNIEPIFGDEQCLHCGQPKPVDPGDMTGYEYDHMNAEIIVDDMKVVDGKLVLSSGMVYRLMLLPDREDMPLNVLRKIEKLVSEGAVIIGNKPTRTNTLKDYPECDEEIKALADKIWGADQSEAKGVNSYGKGKVYWGRTVREVLEELEVGPDFAVSGTENSDQHIDYIHRRTDAEDIYFVSNSSENTETVTCTFRVGKSSVPEIWDAATGVIQRVVDYKKKETGISIELCIEPLGSRFVVFSDKTIDRQFDETVTDLQSGIDQVIASVDISENWSVSFDASVGGPEEYSMDRLMSWTESEDPGVKYFSGTAVYAKDIELEEDDLKASEHAFIQFEEIQEVARVMVNGNDCGIVWTPPYRADIAEFLKAGRNEIIVEVTNVWNNRLVGDVSTPDEKDYTNTNLKFKFNPDSPLLESGLMGKAEIIMTGQQ